eukprot:788493_1
MQISNHNSECKRFSNMATTILRTNGISLLLKRTSLMHCSIRSAVTQIDDVHQFNSIVRSTKKLVVVDYYADWCVPCKRMAPVFERLSNEYDDKCEFLAIDIDRLRELATKLQIQSIPTFDFIKSKKLVNRLIGELPRELEQRIIDLANDTNDT